MSQASLKQSDNFKKSDLEKNMENYFKTIELKDKNYEYFNFRNKRHDWAYTLPSFGIKK